MSPRLKDNLLLNRRVGWRVASLDPTVEFNDAGELSLRRQPGSLRPLVDGAGSFGGLAVPTGLAVDADDQVYILDGEAHVIKRFDPCSETFKALPCIGGKGSAPRQLKDPHGICVSCCGDLYVADTGNHRVQVFALKGLPLRAIWGPLRIKSEANGISVEPASPFHNPQDDLWQPWDIALSTKNNRVYITDYGHGLIHVFDACGRWLKAFNGEAQDEPPFVNPTHIAIDKEGRVYVLAKERDYVTVLDADGKFLERVKAPPQVKDRFCPIALAVDQQGNICLSDRLSRRLYFYCKCDDGSYISSGACRAFNGLSTALVFDHLGNPLLGDAERKQVCCLDANAVYELEGRYYSEPLDSRLYRCQWHRVLLQTRIEFGTRVRIDTFTSESAKSAAEIQGLPETRWSTGQFDTSVNQGEWDCLIQSPPGRFLWLRLTLMGDSTQTPAVEQARIYFPRDSSLQYLPAVYSEDAVSRRFLDSFLSIFDTLWDGISGKLDDIASYFDPQATPADSAGPSQADFLSWLASWMGLTLDRHWPVEKRRQLLSQAYRLYQLRGTPEGLRLHIQLYTGVEPRILEHFKLRRWAFLSHARLGDQTALWGAEIVNRLQLNEHDQIGSFQLLDSGDPVRDPFHVYAHQFTVFVPSRACESETQRQTLERIVEMAKPAHTLGTVRIVEPRFRIGIQAFVGVDTVIGQYPNRVVEGAARLGYDSVIGPSADEEKPPTMRVGQHTRIGSSTLID
jgi:phage tail-like protein